MVRIVAMIAALLGLIPAIGHAQEPAVGVLTFADRVAIRQVVSAQLTALQKDDAPLAFSYASPAIQAQFGTPDNFLRMVKAAYPSVYRPRDVQFRDIEPTENGPVQKVFFFAPNGEPELGLYYMEKEEDGNWKINGCQLTSAPDTSI
jgi:hypothetical protein